ncbi:hypothetical protein, partial [Gordonia soli]|uniref:hypothetical protein n=1 Tax=Gordonia soli TaxID=320799 RepID=UPI00058CA5C7
GTSAPGLSVAGSAAAVAASSALVTPVSLAASAAGVVCSLGFVIAGSLPLVLPRVTAAVHSSVAV